MHKNYRLRKMETEIEENEDIAKEIKRISVKVNKFFSFIPGQYAILSFPGSSIKKPFTIAESDKRKNTISFSIMKKGEFTAKLCGSKPGEKINVDGPYGRFILPSSDVPIIMVAGGIGITPIYSMLTEFIRSKRKSRLSIFYSAKSKEEMAYFRELKDLEDKRISIYLYFTREKAEGYFSGRIDAGKVVSVAGLSGIYYICGPGEMIDGLRKGIEDYGAAPEKILSEEFI